MLGERIINIIFFLWKRYCLLGMFGREIDYVENLEIEKE